MSTINFNANEVEPSTGYDPIPAGKYQAVITESEMKPTKTGNGQYLQLEFEIIEGEYKNRKVWARLNLENANADAVRIARADLSAICRAVNVLQPRDSVELHNLPLTITVRCKRIRMTRSSTRSRATVRERLFPALPQPSPRRRLRRTVRTPRLHGHGNDIGTGTAVAAQRESLLSACRSEGADLP